MITADVYYDKKALTGLMRFSVIDKPWKWIGYGILFAISLALMILNIGKEQLPFTIVWFVFICTICCIVLYAYFANPRIKLKNFNDESIVLNHFAFDENSIKISSESKKKSGTSEIPYFAFVRVAESSTTFYLFVNKTSALIITKSEITNGSAEELKKLLLAKIPNKKINKLSAK